MNKVIGKRTTHSNGERYSMWRVVFDPSEIFNRRCEFAWTDIKNGLDLRTWPNGITFRRVFDGKLFQVRENQLVKVNARRCNVPVLAVD